MSDGPSHSLQQLRKEWRERLRAACDRAVEQVDGMTVANLRALRATIDEEMARLDERLPAPGPVAARGPMTAEEQAEDVQTALRYHALQVRRQVVRHELRRRALGPEAVEETVDVPPTTRHYATLAWEVMGEADVETPAQVYRAVARRADEDVHLTTVERWLREKNPHHPEETERWTELRRAVLLASA
jgi:NADP-dependent 3-hydroxy acid dehydrogenase YdfG